MAKFFKKGYLTWAELQEHADPMSRKYSDNKPQMKNEGDEERRRGRGSRGVVAFEGHPRRDKDNIEAKEQSQLLGLGKMAAEEKRRRISLNTLPGAIDGMTERVSTGQERVTAFH